MKTLVELGGDSGFTLIEMVVVMLVIGILSAIAMPQFARVAEKPKAAEGVHLLLAVKGAQERHFNRYGTYCIGALAGCLDIDLPNPLYFGAIPNTAVSGGSWKLTLSRIGAPYYYGAYTMTFDGNAGTLTCPGNARCQTDLVPANL